MWWALAQQLPGTDLSLLPREHWLLSGGWLHSCRTLAQLLPISGNHPSSMLLKMKILLCQHTCSLLFLLQFSFPVQSYSCPVNSQ